MESGSSRLDEIVDTPLAVESGFVTVPDRPGIGITLRENVLGKFPYRPHKIPTAMKSTAPSRIEGSVLPAPLVSLGRSCLGRQAGRTAWNRVKGG